MNELCFLSNLTSSEWASWVQAIGSIGAIFGAACIAVWQSKQQHKASLDVLRTEKKIARTELAKALLSLSTGELVRLTMIVSSTVRQFRENIEFAVQSHRQMDANQFQTLFEALAALTKSLALTCADIEKEVRREEKTT